MPKKRVFSTREAAEYIGVSEYTLRLSRSNSAAREKLALVAPPYVQVRPGGKVTYLLEDLDDWLAANKRDPRGRPRGACSKKAAT